MLCPLYGPGYDNAPPLTVGGRIFYVLYGLFGLSLFIIAAYITASETISWFMALIDLNRVAAVALDLTFCRSRIWAELLGSQNNTVNVSK